MTALAPAPTPTPELATTVSLARQLLALLRRPVVMCLVLFVAYFGIGLTKDPRGVMVSDSGGKLATLRAMDQRGDLDPDLGYWAEAFDPQGLAHPMALTSHVGDKWVNVTTLPLIYAAVPLYELGGFRAVLLLPMLAGVLIALGAHALARRLGDEGQRAFWLVGLATPVAVYALDFWEHAPGLACMVWGVVLLLDVVDERRGVAGAVAGGLLFGAAATMRTEAIVYAAATFAVFGLVAWRRRRRPPGIEAAGALAGMAVVVVANQLLERWAIGSGVRAGRTSSAAGRFGDDLSVRAKDALITSVGLNRFPLAVDWLLGATTVVALAGATAWLLRGRPDRRRIAFIVLGIATYGYVIWFRQGLGFLPGAFTASPLAAVGLAAVWWKPRLRLVGAVALVALPAVWLFQYSNGTSAIWGGRYLLLSSTLLAVLATVALPQLPRAAAIWVVVLAVAVTASGLAWTSVRTHAVADSWSALARIRGPVVMVQEVQLMREAGAFYDVRRQWLAAGDDRALRVAVRAADESGADRLTLLSVDRGVAGQSMGPYRRDRAHTMQLLPGVELFVTRYRRV